MTRAPVSLLGGGALALALFWLLALLVAPPEADIEVLEPTTLSLVEAEAPTEQAPAETAPPTSPPPPPAAPETPPPMPEPAPLADSPIALPDPELPAVEPPPLELDATLPDLTEQQPEPEPEPQPEPEPAPQPPQAEPEPATEPAEVAEASPSDSLAEATAAPSAAAQQEPVDVGALTPTNRVPPEYPARAQRRGMEGYVELTFVIRPDGSVDPGSIQVVTARPRNVFDKAARQAVARWQFEPGSGLRRARQRLEFQLR
ncbi:energy transducer TonB [Halomonas sp. NO4]|uniref:energy transducer TonB n=1 Tax=Halomonas sp. NO4 TaxID=2484813 RepID=UPI0013CFD4AF|nr:energy transducer TonB [Halomonas sp. NO4]